MNVIEEFFEQEFFTSFLQISKPLTFVFIAVLIGLFVGMKMIEKKRVSFSTRMIIATVVGLVLGLIIQLVAGIPDKPMDIKFVEEVTTWFGLFGGGFIDLIKMLVIPIIMVSIMHVIMNMKDGANLGRLTKHTLIVTVVMVTISVLVGLGVGSLFDVGSTVTAPNIDGEATSREVSNIVGTIRGLIPSNPFKSMVEVNIISLVIVSAFFGVAAKRMSKKYMDVVKPFFDLINALQKIIMSVAMAIIKWMPFAVIPLLANTIASRGLSSILDVGIFIVALYISVAVMFVIQIGVIAFFGYNPKSYLKKSSAAMILAFTSRSSVGSLPLTIETLVNKLGVNEGTASFVAGFGTTAGMQGCAGVFPALVIIFVANVGGIPMDASFIITAIIVIVIGSFGIAGIPGAATMAASVTLSGTGLTSQFHLVSPIIAIDPIIDMGRTLLNVTGSLSNALIVDKLLGTVDMDLYNSKDGKILDKSSNEDSL